LHSLVCLEILQPCHAPGRNRMGEARGHIHKLQTIMLVSMLELEGIDTMEGKWT
jgi:hypothetical protein